MIVFTTSDISEGEEKNPDLSKDVHWCALQVHASLRGLEGGLGTMIKCWGFYMVWNEGPFRGGAGP